MKNKVFQFQKLWVDTILYFIQEQNILDIEEIQNITNEVFQNLNYRGMDFIFNDITDFYEDFNVEQQKSINLLLQNKFGFCFEDFNKTELKAILKAIKTNSKTPLNEKIKFIDNDKTNKLNFLINYITSE